MAKRPSAPNVSAFVRWLFELSGYPSKASFARVSGVTEQELSAWMREGGRGISGANLIRLMTAAGVLEWPGWARPEASEERLDEVALQRQLDYLQKRLDAFERELRGSGGSPGQAVRAL